MIEPSDDRDDAELERQARILFKASVDDLDAATLSRLHRSRQQALDAVAGRKHTGWRWTAWAPVGPVLLTSMPYSRFSRPEAGSFAGAPGVTSGSVLP